MAICIAIQWKNTLSRDYGLFTARLVPAENITRIYFIFHIIQTHIIAVGDDSLRLCLEILQSVHHLRSEERTAILQRRFVDDNRSPLRLDALHHTLNGTLAEVVAVRFHREAVHPDDTFLFLRRIIATPVVVIIISRLVQHPVGNEILARAVALHNRLNQILRHILIVRQQLLRILRQTVAPVAERRIVIMRADVRSRNRPIRCVRTKATEPSCYL